MVERFEESESRLMEENAYLRDMLLSIGTTLDKNNEEISFCREELYYSAQEIYDLRHQLQQKSFVEEESYELESQLKR